ncbi:MAG: DUF2007 domain-containing protein [Alphaproteobacteria bacterium]|nr:DUF2007 domain-containing protein [Alphaproteobacteria bacterium]
MIEVLRTNDLIRLDYAMRLLEAAGCPCFCADGHMSSVEGGISAFQRRILVPAGWSEIARETLRDLDRPPETATDEEMGIEGDADPSGDD